MVTGVIVFLRMDLVMIAFLLLEVNLFCLSIRIVSALIQRHTIIQHLIIITLIVDFSTDDVFDATQPFAVVVRINTKFGVRSKTSSMSIKLKSTVVKTCVVLWEERSMIDMLSSWWHHSAIVSIATRSPLKRAHLA